jgi:hypothetical protein
MAVSRGKQRAHPAPPRVAAEVQAPTEGGELEVLLCVVALVAVVMASPLFPTPELTWTKLFIFACGCVCVDACAAVLREVVGVDVYALVSSIPAHVLRMRCERDERGCVIMRFRLNCRSLCSAVCCVKFCAVVAQSSLITSPSNRQQVHSFQSMRVAKPVPLEATPSPPPSLPSLSLRSSLLSFSIALLFDVDISVFVA